MRPFPRAVSDVAAALVTSASMMIAQASTFAAPVAAFAPPGPATAPRVGDRLVFDVVVRDGGRTERRSIALEVIAADLAPGAPVPEAVRRKESDAKVPAKTPETMKGVWLAERPPRAWALVRVESDRGPASPSRRTFSFVPVELLDVGFHAFAALFRGPEEERPRSDDDLRAQEGLKRALEGLMAFGRILGENEPLREILRAAKDSSFLSPSAKTRLSAIVGGRFTIAFAIDPEPIREIEAPVPVMEGERAFELPVAVLVDQRRLGEFKLEVVRPRAPYSVTAGIFGISATHPEDPERGFVIRLVASTSTP